MRAACLIAACAFLAGCGSGSGGGSGTAGNALTPQPVSGAARVVISTQGPSADTVLYGAQFALRFPPAASLPAATENGMLPEGVLQPAPLGSYGGASYLGSTSGSGPTIRVNIYHPTGFTVGSLATVNCTIAPGISVTAADLTLQDFSARDANGAPIPGVRAVVALQTQ